MEHVWRIIDELRLRYAVLREDRTPLDVFTFLEVGHVKAHFLQERLLVDNIDQPEIHRVAVTVGTPPVVHEDIAGLERELLFADDIQPAPVGNDNNLRKIVDVLRVVRMVVDDEDSQRKIPVGKDQLLFEFDGLGRATSHRTTYDLTAGLQARSVCPSHASGGSRAPADFPQERSNARRPKSRPSTGAEGVFSHCSRSVA